MAPVGIRGVKIDYTPVERWVRDVSTVIRLSKSSIPEADMEERIRVVRRWLSEDI